MSTTITLRTSGCLCAIVKWQWLWQREALASATLSMAVAVAVPVAKPCQLLLLILFTAYLFVPSQCVNLTRFLFSLLLPSLAPLLCVCAA